MPRFPGSIAPQYIAEELLRIEGFSEVRYADVPLDLVHRAVGSDSIDLSIGFIAQYIVELDLATPIVLLSGVHVGCFELFGTKRVNAIRDLKGKTVSVPALGSAHHNFIASMAAYVGVDAKREINFVAHPVSESARLLAEEQVDALNTGEWLSVMPGSVLPLPRRYWRLAADRHQLLRVQHERQ